MVRGDNIKYKITNKTAYPRSVEGKQLQAGETIEIELNKGRAEELKSRIFSLEKIEEFRCDECEETFKSKAGLKRHETAKHKEVKSNGTE